MTSSIQTVIRLSKRARSVSLRVFPYPLRVELVIPHGFSQKKAQAFLEEKREWIHEKATCFLSPIPLSPDNIIPVLGVDTTILHQGNIRAISKWEENMLWIGGLPEQAEGRVKRALRKKLYDEIQKQAAIYATLLQCRYSKISLRETSSRWGSCSSEGNLSFSWRLIFAPLPVLHYVIAHEVAHLQELNHSDNFWKLVSILCPNFAAHRSWLKKHGINLHRYGNK